MWIVHDFLFDKLAHRSLVVEHFLLDHLSEISLGSLPLGVGIAWAWRPRMTVGHVLPQGVLAARNVRANCARVSHVLMGFQVDAKVVLVTELLVADEARGVQFSGRLLLLLLLLGTEVMDSSL